MSTHVAQVPLFEPMADAARAKVPLVTQVTADPQNASEVRVGLQVIGQIGGWNLGEGEWRQAMSGIRDDVTVIDLDIHSKGGSVFLGFWMGNTLLKRAREIGARIETTCYGAAFSIAGYLFMLGEKRTLAENGIIQGHTAWGRVEGNAAVMEFTAEVLRKLDPLIRGAYARHVSLSDEELETAMARESGRGTFWTAEEALTLGFATDIDDLAPEKQDDEQALALADYMNAMHAPADLVARYGQRKTDPVDALVAACLEAQEFNTPAGDADEAEVLALIEECLQGEI